MMLTLFAVVGFAVGVSATWLYYHNPYRRHRSLVSERLRTGI